MASNETDPSAQDRQTAARKANWAWFKANAAQLAREHPNEWVAVLSPAETLFFTRPGEAEQAIEARGLEWEAIAWFLRGQAAIY